MQRFVFGQVRNAVVQFEAIVLTLNIPSALFSMTRVQPGSPMHATLTVHDDCGAWPTFVGAGTGVQ